MFPGAALFLALVAVAIPPLSGDERARLELAYDGRDHQEDAFAALVESVRRWGGALGDTPIRLNPDLAAMIAEPHRFRGDLVRVEGAIQQRSRLARPWESIEEWFLRDAKGRPFIVFVVEPPDESRFPIGRVTRLDARFYKGIDAAARDGQTHQYPAFIGRFPTLTGGPSDAGVRRLWIVLIPVVIMLLAFVALFAYVRRTGPRRRAGSVLLHDRRTVDEPIEPLPGDPAEALAELRRRADAAPPFNGGPRHDHD